MPVSDRPYSSQQYHIHKNGTSGPKFRSFGAWEVPEGRIRVIVRYLKVYTLK